MGGVGSGSWCRWNKKTTTDQVKRIDIRYMKKKGLLKSNTEGCLGWSSNGESVGKISYACYQDCLWLNFRYQRYGEEWQSVEQRIAFDKTPCHFGGKRIWFLCPRCSKRVAVLYGLHKFFLCRHCYQLPYSSQNESDIDNLIQQMHKLGERIFERYEGGEGWGKKKGMHWRTFNRLHSRYAVYEERWRRECSRSYADLTELGIY